MTALEMSWILRFVCLMQGGKSETFRIRIWLAGLEYSNEVKLSE